MFKGDNIGLIWTKTYEKNYIEDFKAGKFKSDSRVYLE